MDEQFTRLSRRAQLLGTHYERYLITAASNHRELVDRLEHHSKLDQVNLWTLQPNHDDQMAILRHIGRGDGEKLEFLATYYALQFLQMNLLALDRLELCLAEGERKVVAYRTFLESQATNYQRLNSAYISALLDLFLKGTNPPRFVICNVGTRWDQDDVDILIVHAQDGDIEALNKALSKVITEFFRRASRLHLYIAERAGLNGFSATIDEYVTSLDRDITDFVMSSELLASEPLVGDVELYEEFRKRVLNRFFSTSERWRRFHVGFLRGLLGEMRSMLISDIREDRIDFKSDSLRLAKGIALAGRVSRNIRNEVQPLEVLNILGDKTPGWRREYLAMGDALLWVETFRLLYQMLIVQEEEIELTQSDVDQLAPIAARMGYTSKGGIPASSHLLVEYYRVVEEIRQICREVVENMTSYMKEKSTYSYLAPDKPDDGKRKRNVAHELATSVNRFSGHLFFEDILRTLKSDGGTLAGKLVQDTMKLKGARRRNVIDGYLQFASSDPTTFLELVLTIHRVAGTQSTRLFARVVEQFLEKMRNEDGLVQGLLGVYAARPEVVNQFVEVLDRSQRQEFESLLEQDLWDEEQRSILARLKDYIWLRTGGSEYYRRLFRRVVNSTPQFIHQLQNVERLDTFALGYLGNSEEGEASTEERIESLGQYYDLAFLSCAIRALRGEPLDSYRVPFIEFADNYMSSLYDECKKRAVEETGIQLKTKDLFAILAAGSYARGQAFDDDYDFIMILDSNSPTLFKLLNTTARFMHRELVKRGTIPQYRYADHFGHFVTRFSEIEEWFQNGRADTIDMTQILGARLLVGSSKFMQRFQDSIHDRIFNDADNFCRQLYQEILWRHKSNPNDDPTQVEIKEGQGGLRDIEQAMLMLKARHQLSGPLNKSLFDLTRAIDTKFRYELNVLQASHAFLRQVRDVYRLAVAADDCIMESELDLVADIFRKDSGPEVANGKELMGLIKVRMNKVWETVECIARVTCKPEK